MRSFKIFGKEISLLQIMFLLIWSIFFGAYIFYIKPMVKGMYLDEDIKIFETTYYWRIYFSIWALVFILLILFKVRFSIKLLGPLFIYFLCFYLIFQNIIVNYSLYINQLYSTTNERIIYKLYNNKKYLQFFLVDEKNDNLIYKDEIDKINIVRKNKNLNEVQDLPNQDSIFVDYKVGIFGFKYLK